MSKPTINVLGRRNSANVQKVMWVLGELELDYVREDVAGSFGIPKGYEALNPNPVVPTIRDGELVLWESNACVRYLAREYGAGSLWPDDSTTLAIADQWMEWQRSDFSAGFFPMFMNRIRIPADKANPVAADRGIATCGRVITQLDAHLADRAYVAGDTLTIGDVPLGPMVYRYLTMEIERPDLPNVQAWYERLAQRPAFQRHVMIPFGRNPVEWNEEEQKNAGIQ